MRESSIVLHPLPDPARRLTAGLPADQALGLRLIALAREAQAVHLFEAVLHTSPPPDPSSLERSQARTLLSPTQEAHP